MSNWGSIHTCSREPRPSTGRHAVNLAKEAVRELRRAREQRRSVKIVHQIEELADMLEAAGAGASKQCKSSVLQAVGEYIHSLESKNAHLEREQCGLVSKIVSIAALARRKHDRTESTTRLDYEQLFLQSSMPMAVAALDGKFTASNDRFAHVLGLREASAVVGRVTWPGRLRVVGGGFGPGRTTRTTPSMDPEPRAALARSWTW